MIIPTYDLYAVLGVPVDADKATIRRAYQRLIREIHPDRHPEHERERLHERAAKVNTAWEYLSDPVKRRNYNATNGFRTATRQTSRPQPEPPPASPPPRTSPPPPRPRRVVQIPETVDFGEVTAGQSAKPQMVWLGFVGGSRVHSVELDRETGQFWDAVAERAEDERSVHIYFFGLPIPPTTPSGRQDDQVHVQLDEVAIDIALSVTVKSAPQPPARIPDPPPFRPMPSPPPPRRPATPPPPPRPTPVFTPNSRPRRWRGKLIATLVTGGLLWVGLMLLSGQLGSRHSAPLTSYAPSGQYCSVSRDGGQILDFYRTKPATRTRASDTQVWTIMVPHDQDSYIAVWSPRFPYWIRMNRHDGFTANDRSYAAFEYVEVLPVWSDPWEPLSTVFTSHPGLTGGQAAAVTELHLFASSWAAELNSEHCS